ncbi:MAG: hypothetical protein ACI4TK_13245 [Agathobacter sp.]
MKKVLSFFIICAMICLSVLPCYAFYWPSNCQPSVDLSNPNISGKDQAKLDELAEAVANVHDFWCSIHFRMPATDTSITPPGYDTEYYKVIESALPGGSFAGLVSVANSLFVSELAEKTYTYYSITQQIPLFYRSNDELYAYRYTFGFQYYPFTIFNYRDAPKMYFDNMVITDTSASGRVLYCLNVDGPIEYWSPLLWYDVLFEKGDDGIWKMADCGLFRHYFDSRDFNNQEYICYDRQLYDQFGVTYDLESPPTGDTAGERVALLGAVSLACIIPAACLTLKRRRKTAD